MSTVQKLVDIEGLDVDIDCIRCVLVRNLQSSMAKMADEEYTKSNKLCAWRHNMPPPLSSLVARRRADAT